MFYTPPHSHRKRPASPPLSVAGSSQFTTTPQPKLNVVTRLALEGKARHADDGATVRMYLKLSIPMDSVSPGSTVPLFPEENLKLLSAHVHPLDIHSSPYNFSSISFPNLSNAARALHLPALSQKSYLSVFSVPTSASTTVHSTRASAASSAANNTPPLDEKYTGHIIVSGYNISYILPKEFPPRFDGGDNPLRVSTFSTAQKRRPSVGERNSMHFMAALELWIPYVSRPPKAPFLISIPVPRCLSNSIKLRIHPPVTASTSSSMASLSSADENPGAWELASEPYVTRNVSRSGSSADMADDESSDSSTYADGSSGGILVQGTFPSTERVRIRWAQPAKSSSNNDGRRRVGVKEVQGEMTVAVLRKAQDLSSGHEGILMRLEYKGTCKGVWFPGVATMLGMDIGLKVKDGDVVWPPGEDAHWVVTGGTGYTGFDVGQPSTPVSRQPSPEFPAGMSISSVLHSPPVTTPQEYSPSTSSLLRAPLPNDHLPDYTFESSPISMTPSVTLSSVSSLPTGRSRAPSDAVASGRSPAVPITIHININDIIQPSKNVFTFSITGTILILPRLRSQVTERQVLESDLETNPVVLPRFCVLATDSETVSTLIRNESEGNIVEVYYISGNPRDAQTRKTVLQRNGVNRCGNDGARIAIRPISQASAPRAGDQVTDNMRFSPRHSPLNEHKTMLSHLHGRLMGRRRNGPVVIASVHAIVTPLLVNGTGDPGTQAVRVLVHAPSNPDSDWLEFGIAQVASKGKLREYTTEIVSASLDGVPMHFESSMFTERDKKAVIDLVPSYGDKTGHRWITWVKVHGGSQGGLITVNYVVHEIENSKVMKRGTEIGHFDVLIPTFALPIGLLEVTVETHLEMVALQSNFAHQQAFQDRYKLLHHSLDQFFTPVLSLAVKQRNSGIRAGWLLLQRVFLVFLWVSSPVLVLVHLTYLGTEIKDIRRSLDRLDTVARASNHSEIIPSPSTETVYITTTVFSPLPSATMNTDNLDTPVTPSSSIMTTPSINPTFSTPGSSTCDQPRTDVLTPTPVPTPHTSSHLSESSLVAIPALPFEWSKIQISFPPGVWDTVDKVLEGLGIVWQIFRKAYHYPLDPP